MHTYKHRFVLTLTFLVLLFTPQLFIASAQSTNKHSETNPNNRYEKELLGTCTKETHDQYVVAGKDGKQYSTWHPQQDPSGCVFGHEHGDDPTKSRANSSLPAFGYAANQVGMNESHEGFKIYVANRGDTNDEGRVALADSRIMVHMGTTNPRRFAERLHSFQYDLEADHGYFVHVEGMADTGDVGSICQRNANSRDNNPTNDVGRTVVVPKGNGCDLGSLYEVWAFNFRVGDKLNIHASSAVFDPISVMNPHNSGEFRATKDEYGTQAFGCQREAYHGPVYWYNQDGETTYNTDAYGNIQENGVFTQRISAHQSVGIPMTHDQTLFKQISNQCSLGGIGKVN